MEEDRHILLRNNLARYFSKAELALLANDLSIGFDDLSGDTLEEKALALVQYCYRRALESMLIERASMLRPNAKWPPVDPIVPNGRPSELANQRQIVSGRAGTGMDHELFMLTSIRASLEKQRKPSMHTPGDMESEIAFIDNQIQLVEGERSRASITATLTNGLRRNRGLDVPNHPRPYVIGRTKELNTLLPLLSPSNPGKVYLVKGMPGVGKSTLALAAGYQAVDRGISDGIIILDMPGDMDSADRLDPIHSITESIVLQARALSGGELEIHESTRLGAVRQALTALNGPYTIIVDNLQSDLNARTYILDFLRDAVPSNCKVIITSTFHSTGVDYILPLKGMEYPEASFFMRREAAMKDANTLVLADYRQLRRALEWTSGIPLAMRWLVGYVSEAAQSLRRVLDDLQMRQEDEDSLLKDLFEQSFKLIESEGSKLSVLFALSTFTTHANWESLLYVSHVSDAALRDATSSLYRLSLVEFNSLNNDEEYRLLPITRRFVRKLAQKSGRSTNFYIRAVDYYLNTFQGKDELALQSPDTWKSFNRERRNILSILDWCIDNDRWESFIEIGLKTNAALGYSGNYTARLRYATQLLKAAEQFNKPELQAWILVHEVGWITQHTGDYETAESATRQGIQIASTKGYDHALALGKRNLGILFYRKAKREPDSEKRATQFREALTLMADALNLFESLDTRWLAITLRGEAMIKQEMGELIEAGAIFQKALVLHRQVGDFESEALTISDLGALALASADYGRSREYLTKALELDERQNRPFGRARNRQRLAHLEGHFGDLTKATTLMNEALAIYQQMNASKAIEVLEKEAEILGIQLMRNPRGDDEYDISSLSN